jgi:GTP diphosphokinase / guanosine-3',5'-bis(diphosphate) 3'-diphosphatase
LALSPGEMVSLYIAKTVAMSRWLNPERVVEVEWSSDSKGVFMVQIQVEALDRSGLLSDVTRVLTENHVNILERFGFDGPRQSRAKQVCLSKWLIQHT